MERLMMEQLKKWKDKKRRKPLILWGARQVGKTWLMKEFGRTCFDNVVYVSFYNNTRIAAIFEQDYDVQRILNALEIELHSKIKAENTLLNIQNYPVIQSQYVPQIVSNSLITVNNNLVLTPLSPSLIPVNNAYSTLTMPGLSRTSQFVLL